MVFDEAETVVDRVNRHHATTAVLLQLAVSSVLSKKAGKAFDREIKKLTN